MPRLVMFLRGPNLHFEGLFHPYFGGVKPSFFMVLGSKGIQFIERL